MTDAVDVHPDVHHYETGTPKLRAERRGHVATLTFDNPDKLNALAHEMQRALPEVVTAIQADDEARVLVMTGAGDRAFVSGADISEFEDRRTDPDDRAVYDRAGSAAGSAWAAFRKPVIARIRGYCIGGGLLTALAADFRIASDDSQFGVPAAKLGLGYPLSGVDALAGVVGRAWAAEILFTARRLSAHEALQAGLVNRVVPVQQLDDAVADLADRIAANAPLTIAAVKASLQQLRRPPDQRDHDGVADLVEACFRSDDYREGQAAFLERRTPRFRGQ